MFRRPIWDNGVIFWGTARKKDIPAKTMKLDHFVVFTLNITNATNL